MHLQQLRYVITAGKLKNFSKAAKELFVAQPTLSQQIMNLEQELGVALFVRHSKSVSLTPAGKEFVLYAEKILNDIDSLQENMEKHRTLDKGSLTLGCPWIIGYLSLSQCITRFSKEFPHIDTSIKINGSKKLLDMLYNHEVDAIFILGGEDPFPDDKVSYRKVVDDRFMVVVSVDNPLSKKDSIEIADLANEKIIMPSPDSILRPIVESRFEQADITPNIICETSQSDVCIQLASAGFGIAFASESIATSLYNQQFRAVPLVPTIHRPIYYVTLKGMEDYPTIDTFTKYILSIYHTVANE